MSANLIEIDISKIANMHVLFMHKNSMNWNFQVSLQFLTLKNYIVATISLIF